MRTKVLLALLTLLTAPGAARAQADARAQTPTLERLRRELRTLEALLDQTVAQVSPPNPGFVLAGAPASRGYLLRGHGVVFVLAPRRLPLPMVTTRMRGRIVFQGSGQASDLRQLEVQVAEFQAQVHREWQALEQSFDEVQARIWAAAPNGASADRRFQVAVPPPGRRPAAEPPDSASPLTPAALEAPPPAPSAPVAPLAPSAPEPPLPPSALEAPAPSFPAPPWIQWSEEAGEAPEPRSPEQVVADTRDALLQTLEGYGHLLTSLSPDETISVVVDFVAGTPFVDDRARAARSLSLRVSKRDLDDRKAGRLSAEELRRRIETTEY
jgi:hypothetical protein